MIEKCTTVAAHAPVSPADVPERFYCPISCDVMRDPVTTEHGQTFDRAWIKLVIDAGKPCPLTRQIFTTHRLVANTELKAAIESHPEAAALAREAEAPPAVRDPSADTAGRARDTFANQTFERLVAPLFTRPTGAPSIVLRPTDSIMATFLVGNAAGVAHCKFSRANLLDKIQRAKRQLSFLETQGARLQDRAALAGRISELQTRLAFARAASPVTTPLDVVLGTYTASRDNEHDWRRVGATGIVLWPLAVCCGPIAGCAAQSASLLGAGVKAGVRLASQGPAKVAAAMARQRYVRNADDGVLAA